tara:strand:- start:65 stop:325 length:261 start_codon:yes stop_codon:yes gene_type:complete
MSVLEEAVITIKTSESELDCLIWALGMVKTVRLPIEPEWKKPYKILLKDLQKIKDGVSEAKRSRINDQKEEELRGVICKSPTNECD